MRINHPPVIESLTATPDRVVQGQTTKLECIASDANGDELNCKWDAGRGNFSGEGASVTWTSPLSCADYAISVTVTDGKGGEVS